MLKKIAKVLGMAVAGLVVVGAVSYLAGLRVVLDGGGTPTVGFVESADDRAEAIARHRDAQRKQPPPPAPAAPA
ncbi:MAG TPA: hypothetical protein VJ813_16450, partial [Vicinamibacterales bacterium]|nr:hypothetical protein [Vicinamibacterales bacterium]